MVANFGLLSEQGDGWLLTCEESIGGLLLAAAGDDAVGLVSTEAGVFERTGSLCEWNQGPELASNEWALRFSVPQLPSGNADERFALVIDRETQQLEVERATAGQDFSVVHSFDSLSGYRQLVSAGDPAGIFVAGYTLDPRTWNLAYSLDSGDTWRETTPDVDNETATMVLRLVDPEAPNVLLFQAETTPGTGQEVWRFDAADETSERLLALDDGEVVGGMTFNGGDLWVAARRRSTGVEEVGSLYRASRENLEFEKVVDESPPLSCLDAFGGTLYGCINDPTYRASFAVGLSDDDGQTWQPYLSLADLGNVASCGAECCATVYWLTGDYGITGSAGAGADIECSTSAGGAPPTGEGGANGGTGGSRDAGGASGARGNTTVGGAGSERPRKSSGGCGCSLPPSGQTSFGQVALLGAFAFARRRRSHSLGKRARLLGVLAALLALACSSDGGDSKQGASGAVSGAAGAPGDGHDADCQRHGAELSGLELSSDTGITLEFLETIPAPPAVGDNTWLVAISDAKGSPLGGLEDALFVTPFMPEHGHGTPVTVGVEEVEDGHYRLSPVNTFMPGLWQITLEIDAGEVSESFEFEVCVE